VSAILTKPPCDFADHPAFLVVDLREDPLPHYKPSIGGHRVAVYKGSRIRTKAKNGALPIYMVDTSGSFEMSARSQPFVLSLEHLPRAASLTSRFHAT
jgi:hypothetical protein